MTTQQQAGYICIDGAAWTERHNLHAFLVGTIDDAELSDA